MVQQINNLTSPPAAAGSFAEKHADPPPIQVDAGDEAVRIELQRRVAPPSDPIIAEIVQHQTDVIGLPPYSTQGLIKLATSGPEIPAEPAFSQLEPSKTAEQHIEPSVPDKNLDQRALGTAIKISKEIVAEPEFAILAHRPRPEDGLVLVE